MTDRAPGSALIVGASRGLGLGIVEELHRRRWRVTGTVRDAGARTGLHELVDGSGGAIRMEEVDTADDASVAALRTTVADRRFDVLFVSAGTTSDEETPIGDVSTEAFVRLMIVNALGPMRTIERLKDLVPDDGLIGAMTSGQGSITNNETGSRELYRGSKAALNMFMRSFADRREERRRSHVLLAPGWIRTALGGDDAPYTLEESVPKVVDVLLSRRGRPGIAYLDRDGADVPW